MSGTRKWIAAAAVLAAIAGVCGYVGGPLARACLSAEIVLLIVGLSFRNQRAAQRTQTLLRQEMKARRELKTRLRGIDARMKRLHRHVDQKMAVGVQKIDDRVKFRQTAIEQAIRAQAAAIRDQLAASQAPGVGAGLDALNRYVELAERVRETPSATDATD